MTEPPQPSVPPRADHTILLCAYTLNVEGDLSAHTHTHADAMRNCIHPVSSMYCTLTKPIPLPVSFQTTASAVYIGYLGYLLYV